MSRFSMAHFAPLIALLLVSCATPPVDLAEDSLDVAAKRFSVAAGKANIYVVRTGGYTSSMRNLPVLIDGVHRGFLSDEMYFRFEVDPGARSVVSFTSEDQGIVTINAVAGNNYFVGYTTKIGWRDHMLEAKELSNDEGMSAVRKSKLAKRIDLK